jgi:hypothetical protein
MPGKENLLFCNINYCEAAILYFRAWEERAFFTFSPLPPRLPLTHPPPWLRRARVARIPGLGGRQQNKKRSRYFVDS